MSTPTSDVTRLLQDWSQGNPSALEKLIPLVFEDLRDIAKRLFQRESDGHTLQPTALVNEVYLRLFDQKKIRWQNRQQFFGVAALMMRRILVDYAKGRQAAKRGSGAPKVSLDESLAIPELINDADLVVALDDALSRLGKIDSRQGKIVEMRFFTGLSHEEIADLLEVSVTTVKREWRTARLWLYRELAQH
ncbi:MAG TPA: sigma-70 family RNA polymerase sigma factor [Thermoanaerobaculia bacterium]|jgi:RNA polymerase sigma factor (TIGR02999 family)|nr:sigma-70 family RNA polymerase sigma factor [Thermoanaerobaculia bacterium]